MRQGLTSCNGEQFGPSGPDRISGSGLRVDKVVARSRKTS